MSATLLENIDIISTQRAALLSAAKALVAQLEKDIYSKTKNSHLTDVAYGALVTAGSDYVNELGAMVDDFGMFKSFPTVTVDDVVYDIIEPSVSYNGTIYSAEDISADEELAAALIDEEVGYIVPHVTTDFTATPLSGAHPRLVTFTDSSSEDALSWTWDFGDGSGSTLQNPSHNYLIAGTFTVVLTSGNGRGTDTKTRTDYITIS